MVELKGVAEPEGPSVFKVLGLVLYPVLPSEGVEPGNLVELEVCPSVDFGPAVDDPEVPGVGAPVVEGCLLGPTVDDTPVSGVVDPEGPEVGGLSDPVGPAVDPDRPPVTPVETCDGVVPGDPDGPAVCDSVVVGCPAVDEPPGF